MWANSNITCKNNSLNASRFFESSNPVSFEEIHEKSIETGIGKRRLNSNLTVPVAEVSVKSRYKQKMQQTLGLFVKTINSVVLSFLVEF